MNAGGRAWSVQAPQCRGLAAKHAQASGQLARRLRVLTDPAPLVVDEIGCLPVSRDGAVLFFQLVNARHEHASTVLASNKGFEEWGAVLGDEVMAAALIDRLLHHCHIVNIRGNSVALGASTRNCGAPCRAPRRTGKPAEPPRDRCDDGRRAGPGESVGGTPTRGAALNVCNFRLPLTAFAAAA